MLRRNYRSSAALLQLPSQMFYNDSLIAEADEAQTRPPEWVRAGPVPVHAVASQPAVVSQPWQHGGWGDGADS